MIRRLRAFLRPTFVAFLATTVTASLALADGGSNGGGFVWGVTANSMTVIEPVWPAFTVMPVSSGGYNYLTKMDIWDLFRMIDSNRMRRSSAGGGGGSAGGGFDSGGGGTGFSTPPTSGESGSDAPGATNGGIGTTPSTSTGQISPAVSGDSGSSGMVSPANCPPESPVAGAPDRLAADVGRAVTQKHNEGVQQSATLPPEQLVDKLHIPDKCEKDLVPQDAKSKEKMDQMGFRSLLAARKPRFPAPHTRLPHQLISDPRHSKGWCLRGVREAITGNGLNLGNDSFGIDSAKSAGPVLQRKLGMKNIMGGLATCHHVDPAQAGAISKAAPAGAVLVYAGGIGKGAPFGHIEIKTSENMYCSDFCSPNPIDVNTRLGRKLIGVYVPSGK